MSEQHDEMCEERQYPYFCTLRREHEGAHRYEDPRWLWTCQLDDWTGDSESAAGGHEQHHHDGAQTCWPVPR